MSGGQAAIKGSNGADALGAWRAVRANGDIQFSASEFKPRPPPQTPAWLEALGRFLKRIFQPLGEGLGVSWPVLEKILIAVALLALLFIAWRLIAPLIADRRPKTPGEPVREWTPQRDEAIELLEHADRLAAEGKYDEATHLLLRRSVGQISQAHPGLLGPASTAREIAGLPMLPEGARSAFELIARGVERSFFALIPLGSDDWHGVRTAYADFALAGLGA